MNNPQESEKSRGSINERELETRDEAMMDNFAKYTGQWRIGTMIREGKGVQIWPDGSIYEGWWRENKAHGRGRIIHANGDIYEGDWMEDRAHGYGVYMNSGGARYEGKW